MDEFLDASPVELPSTVEHYGRRKDEHRPLCTTRISGPERAHKPHTSRIVARDERHIHNADDEGWYREDHSRDQTKKQSSLLVSVQKLCPLLN